MSSTLTYLNYCIAWLDSQRDTIRQHGPCAIEEGGQVLFSQLNSATYNRRNGPSIIRPNGSVTYKHPTNGIHRTDGPAVIYASGKAEYWVHDRKISADQFFLEYGVV